MAAPPQRLFRNPFITFLLVSLSLAAGKSPVASWTFDRAKGGDPILGYSKFVPGVSGTGLRFDGQTTSVVRAADKAPRLGGAFTIEAWAAIQAYPWTWCALVNQEKDRKTGYLFGLDPEGFFGLQLAVGGTWVECRSDAPLPLYAWSHLAATYDAASGITLYRDGKPAGRKAVSGKPAFAPAADLWLGRNLTPLGLSQEVKVVAEVAYSFDGIIDEVRIHDRALGPDEIQAAHSALAPAGPALATIEAQVEVVEPMGAETFVHGRIGSNPLVARVHPRTGARVGQPLALALDTARLHAFDPETEEALA